jgi:hypothetical protein
MLKKFILILIAVTVISSCSDDKSTTPIIDEEKPIESLYYAEFNFDNNLEDSGRNNFNGTSEYTIFVEDRNGKEKSAIYFDGSNSVLLPYDGMLDFESDFAISFWAKVGEQHNIKSSSHYDIISNSVWFVGSYFIGINSFEQYQTMSWNAQGEGIRLAYDKEVYFDEQWHHIAYNFELINDETTIATLYIDGIQKQRDEIHTPVKKNWQPRIGARVDLEAYFTGTLDDLIISDSLFTKKEIEEQAGIVSIVEE